MLRHEEKEFLDLLQEYKSEDTKKARRNLSTIAFIVIACWILGIRILDIKAFGIDLSHSAELYVLLIGLVLLGYWLVMFVLLWRHDHEIQNERALLLQAKVSSLLARKLAAEETIERNKKNGFVPDDYVEIKAQVEAYERQKARTETASKLGRIIRGLELFVPISLAALCAGILVCGIGRAL